MNEIKINEKISFIPASDNPLSADIGIIRENGVTWLYDVGNGEKYINLPDEGCNIVLSHFHQDHTGNLDMFNVRELYLSKETYAHIHRGTIVSDSICRGNLRIFPLPSSHTKGCLGLGIDGSYAFVGDALYSKVKDGYYTYNTQLLKQEIAVLKSLNAPFLLVSHFEGMIRKKEDVIAELAAVYNQREKDKSEIKIKYRPEG